LSRHWSFTHLQIPVVVLGLGGRINLFSLLSEVYLLIEIAVLLLIEIAVLSAPKTNRSS
jgi:hypothetical protein